MEKILETLRWLQANRAYQQNFIPSRKEVDDYLYYESKPDHLSKAIFVPEDRAPDIVSFYRGWEKIGKDELFIEVYALIPKDILQHEHNLIYWDHSSESALASTSTPIILGVEIAPWFLPEYDKVSSHRTNEGSLEFFIELPPEIDWYKMIYPDGKPTKDPREDKFLYDQRLEKYETDSPKAFTVTTPRLENMDLYDPENNYRPSMAYVTELSFALMGYTDHKIQIIHYSEEDNPTLRKDYFKVLFMGDRMLPKVEEESPDATEDTRKEAIHQASIFTFDSLRLRGSFIELSEFDEPKSQDYKLLAARSLAKLRVIRPALTAAEPDLAIWFESLGLLLESIRSGRGGKISKEEIRFVARINQLLELSTEQLNKLHKKTLTVVLLQKGRDFIAEQAKEITSNLAAAIAYSWDDEYCSLVKYNFAAESLNLLDWKIALVISSGMEKLIDESGILKEQINSMWGSRNAHPLYFILGLYTKTNNYVTDTDTGKEYAQHLQDKAWNEDLSAFKETMEFASQCFFVNALLSLVITREQLLENQSKLWWPVGGGASKANDYWLGIIENLLDTAKDSFDFTSWAFEPSGILTVLIEFSKILKGETRRSDGSTEYQYVEDMKLVEDRLGTIEIIEDLPRVAAVLVVAMAASYFSGGLASFAAEELLSGLVAQWLVEATAITAEFAVSTTAFTAVHRMGDEITGHEPQNPFLEDWLTNAAMFKSVAFTGKAYKLAVGGYAEKLSLLGKVGLVQTELITLHAFGALQQSLAGLPMSLEEHKRAAISNILLVGGMKVGEFVAVKFMDRVKNYIGEKEASKIEERFGQQLSMLESERAKFLVDFEVLEKGDVQNAASGGESIFTKMERIFNAEVELLKKLIEKNKKNKNLKLRFLDLLGKYRAKIFELELSMARLTGESVSDSLYGLHSDPSGMIAYKGAMKNEILAHIRENAGAEDVIVDELGGGRFVVTVGLETMAFFPEGKLTENSRRFEPNSDKASTESDIADPQAEPDLPMSKATERVLDEAVERGQEPEPLTADIILEALQRINVEKLPAADDITAWDHLLGENARKLSPEARALLREAMINRPEMTTLGDRLAIQWEIFRKWTARFGEQLWGEIITKVEKTIQFVREKGKYITAGAAFLLLPLTAHAALENFSTVEIAKLLEIGTEIAKNLILVTDISGNMLRIIGEIKSKSDLRILAKVAILEKMSLEKFRSAILGLLVPEQIVSAAELETIYYLESQQRYKESNNRDSHENEVSDNAIPQKFSEQLLNDALFFLKQVAIAGETSFVKFKIYLKYGNRWSFDYNNPAVEKQILAIFERAQTIVLTERIPSTKRLFNFQQAQIDLENLQNAYDCNNGQVLQDSSKERPQNSTEESIYMKELIMAEKLAIESGEKVVLSTNPDQAGIDGILYESGQPIQFKELNVLDVRNAGGSLIRNINDAYTKGRNAGFEEIRVCIEASEYLTIEQAKNAWRHSKKQIMPFKNDGTIASIKVYCTDGAFYLPLTH
jgi:hypothetical protein